MRRTTRRHGVVLLAIAALLATGGCTLGEPSGPVAVPSDGAPTGTAVEEALDAGGLTDDEVGYPRQPEGPDDYGLDAPTLNLCEAR